MPTFRFARLFFGTAALLGCTVAMSSCLEILAPCNTIGSDSDRLKFMDGSWTLVTIDGNLFANSYSLPDGATLLKATMDFHTLELPSGSCDSPTKSTGDVIALYRIKGRNGVEQPPKVQVGHFSYENDTEVVTLSALGKSATGSATLRPLAINITVRDESILRMRAVIPAASSGSSGTSGTHDMLFTRELRR